MSTANPRLLFPLVFYVLLISATVIHKWLTPLTPAQRIAVESGLERNDTKSSIFLGSVASVCQESQDGIAQQIIKAAKLLNESGSGDTPIDILSEVGMNLNSSSSKITAGYCKRQIDLLVDSKYKK